MTKGEHVHAICCRSEVAGNAISGRNVKTIERYVVVYFEVASCSSLRDIQQVHRHNSDQAARRLNIVLDLRSLI